MPLNIVISYLSSTAMDADFNTPLHQRGTDFAEYKNAVVSKGLAFDASDSELLRQVLGTLLVEDSGVFQVHVQNPYRLRIHYSAAVPAKDITDRVMAVAKRAGKVPILA